MNDSVEPEKRPHIPACTNQNRSLSRSFSFSGPLRWSIIVVDLDPVEGHEQAGRRRALVVSYEPFHRSGLATVCPITAARADARYPGDVPIRTGEAGQTRDGIILTSQVRTISQRRFRSSTTSATSKSSRNRSRILGSAPAQE